MRLSICSARKAACAGALLGLASVFTAGPGFPQQEPSAAELMDDLMWDRGPIGGPFTLRDQEGRARSLDEFRGSLVLLYFGYMHCPDVCPTDLQEIGAAIDALGTQGDRVTPIFITIDPERDTSQALASYVPSFHPRLLGLTGELEDIRRIATSYKVSFKKVDDPRSTQYVMDHSAFIYLLGADGKYLGFFPPGTKSDRILEVVRPHLAALAGR